MLAQITRHRIASFSVQSQRYVKKDNFIYITPPAISENREINNIYEKSILDSFEQYNKIADMLSEKYYNEFINSGVSEKQARSKAEKKAIEDAKKNLIEVPIVGNTIPHDFVLPNACETKMVVTMNARSLLNFFRLRCCNRAQWEIRAVAIEMLKLCYKTAPSIFSAAGPACCNGSCSEGKMSCGKMSEVKKTFSKIKESLKDEEK